MKLKRLALALIASAGLMLGPAASTASAAPVSHSQAGDLSSCTCDCGNGAPNGGTFAMNVVSVCANDRVRAYAVCWWYPPSVTQDVEGNWVYSPGYSTASCGGGAAFQEIIQWGKRWQHDGDPDHDWDANLGPIYTANWGTS